ncbi:fos-related antigen 2-like isoform X2 [Lytechinus variegatus]|uniref:fos-related antigen 2-like isoform X2 n=1 Tax=Lytechinus variegatus TaxID=7654 RepID=UPI001BB29222|nr:fos-related antigen 2-like isoform X2 [Lytechinus variegatus]
MYPTVTMPADDGFLLTTGTMASGCMPATSEDYTASEDIMDISSYAPTMSNQVTSLPNAIPTSVITPTTSLTGGSWLEHPNNIHGGSFVPPSVSSHNGYHTPAVVRGGGGIGGQHPHHPHQRIARERGDMDMYRMSPSSGPRRRIRDDDLTPDEREKRRVRRERNKLAAAKCRQRRVDHTNTLINETEDWEEKNATLEQEISKLQQQKEQLEFILEAHKAMCRKNKVNKETATTASCTTTTTCRANTVASLDTPTTEVVTPTRLFNFAGLSEGVMDGTNHSSSGSSSCGREAMSIKSENSSSGSDMSSPESARRTLIQL